MTHAPTPVATPRLAVHRRSLRDAGTKARATSGAKGTPASATAVANPSSPRYTTSTCPPADATGSSTTQATMPRTRAVRRVAGQRREVSSPSPSGTIDSAPTSASASSCTDAVGVPGCEASESGSPTSPTEVITSPRAGARADLLATDSSSVSAPMTIRPSRVQSCALAPVATDIGSTDQSMQSRTTVSRWSNSAVTGVRRRTTWATPAAAAVAASSMPNRACSDPRRSTPTPRMRSPPGRAGPRRSR